MQGEKHRGCRCCYRRRRAREDAEQQKERRTTKTPVRLQMRIELPSPLVNRLGPLADPPSERLKMKDSIVTGHVASISESFWSSLDFFFTPKNGAKIVNSCS